MPSLATLVTAKTRRPSATLWLNGARCRAVISLARAQQFGGGVSSGTIVLRDPPVTPALGMAARWTWGYNGVEVPGFTGEITDIKKLSYPDRYQLEVKDPLYKAELVTQDIQTDPLNDIAASDAVAYILSHYAGITRMDIPALSASGSAWGGSAWTLGTLTPVAWSATTALRAAQDICSVLGYWLFCDAGGVVRARQMERKPSNSPLRTFARGVDLLVQGAPEREQPLDAIHNRVVVLGADTGVEGAQVTDAWQTDHPLLPRGVYRELTYSTALIEYVTEAEAGAASCTGVAKRLVALHSRRPNVIRARIKADPRIQVGATIGIRDMRIGYSTAKLFFVYGDETTLTAASGAFDQQLTLDGGTGDTGYTTIPDPTAVFSYDLFAETLDGTTVVDVVVDGSASHSNSEGEIVSWAWSATGTPYGSTPSSGSGERFTFVYPAGGSVDATLTVTDTTSKTNSVTQTIALAGDSLTTPRARVLNVAFGAAWEVTPDGGQTWGEETSGAATLVPPIGAGADSRAPSDSAATYGLLATRGASATGIRQTRDALVTASTSLASIGTTLTALWVNEADPTRVWVAAGSALYRSTDGGATVTAMTAPGGTIAWVQEDPAVPDSVFVCAGAHVYHTTTPASGGWAVLYAGPAGATARMLTRSRDGQITWICYTGTFTGEPAQRIETGASAILPATAPAEIRAVALDPAATVDGGGTLYLFGPEDPANIYTCDALTGLSAARLSATFPAGAVVQHAIADPDLPVVYTADFDSVAVGTGAVRKLIRDTGELLLYRQGASGRQAHRVGLGPLRRQPIAVTLLMVATGAGVGGVDGVWRWRAGAWADVSGDLPVQGWRGVVASPADPQEWIVWDESTAYRTTNGGTNWTAITNIWDSVGPDSIDGIRAVAFSPDGSAWAMAGTAGDTFILQELGFLTTGAGNAGTATTTWVAEWFAHSAEHARPRALVYAGATIVVATWRIADSTYEWLRDDLTVIADQSAYALDVRPGTAQTYGATYDPAGQIWRSGDPATEDAAQIADLGDGTMLACGDALYIATSDGVRRIAYSDANEDSTVALAGQTVAFVRASRQQDQRAVAALVEGLVGGTGRIAVTDGDNGWTTLDPAGATGGIGPEFVSYVEVIAEAAT